MRKKIEFYKEPDKKLEAFYFVNANFDYERANMETQFCGIWIPAYPN